ncbi:2-oxo-4-hydroxy-4-carboxy-5-ureidoimidazoline decarboxylase [Nonomuraea muscovyensis]|uniref:2-oxo-4-hydroxy-4-carboxy-5-ureidoimidazoline decarboxylase n=1 Tax=Nonomuraea muscovyensis TaxID=1124761 RepID=A0A7X0EWY2_9ACTN|nr:2-oxo-4-hydroxy-4-carboxy-5-ureidoimidazoline decarboxylase [Nonomuraea muscovyensis]MBB6344091.1 2-oxo-4-hydroxy-4-carboxy-5-ureidoimidazoline decarboxylase [Nonomuraea muscovyensis]
MPHTRAGLDRFNALAPEDAERDLLACCASRAFAAAVTAGRPYPGPGALADAAEAAVRALGWPDVLEALEAHPRIGARPGGAGREAAWSRQEQAGLGAGAAGSGADGGEDGLRQALADGNRAYEDRFGHVHLVCATGLTGTEMLAGLRERLGNDDDTERGVVRDHLARITRLRIAKLLGEAP